jgi:exonuclease III
MRANNINRLIWGHININSLRNKFDSLISQLNENLDIILISETKLDDSFPPNQFFIQGYGVPYRFDRNGNGGGMILYIREDIPSKLLNPKCENKEFEHFYVELNLRNKKWLIICAYNPKTNLIAQNLNNICKNIDYFSNKYDNYIFMGDFNAEITNHHVNEFLNTYNLKSLIKEPTCFKSLAKPTCIDLILTNHPRCFCHSKTIETGLSDFHKLTVTVLKASFPKTKPKIINYRAYRNFDNSNFRYDLINTLNNDINLAALDFDFDSFKDCVIKVLEKHAPERKSLYVITKHLL